MLKNRIERMPNKANLWKFDSSEFIDKHVYSCQKCSFLTIYPTEYLIHYEWHALGPERFVNLGLQFDSSGCYVTKQAYKKNEGFAIVQSHLEKSMARNLAFKIEGSEPLYLLGADAKRYNEYFSSKAHHIRADLKVAVEKFYQEHPKLKWTEDWTEGDKDFALKTLGRSSGRGTPDFLDDSDSNDIIGKFFRVLSFFSRVNWVN